MQDLIRRQAVRLIESDPDAYPQEWNDDYEKGFTDALNKVLVLPSAHPERPFVIQDVLDYLDTELHPIVSPECWNVYSELHDMISMLSSAQPEIIRCKDCKWSVEHYDTDGNAPYWICNNWDGGTDEDGFCYEAERRTYETD